MSTTFLKHFESITDPRIERCKKHNLLDILLLAISAVLSGAEGWEDIEDFGHLKLDWLRIRNKLIMWNYKTYHINTLSGISSACLNKDRHTVILLADDTGSTLLENADVAWSDL